MTIDEVARLRERKDCLTYKDARRGRFPVTAVWINRDRTMARVRIHSVAGEDWLPIGEGDADVFTLFIPARKASHNTR